VEIHVQPFWHKGLRGRECDFRLAGRTVGSDRCGFVAEPVVSTSHLKPR
jgi:hypothetical protein